MLIQRARSRAPLESFDALLGRRSPRLRTTGLQFQTCNILIVQTSVFARVSDFSPYVIFAVS